MPLLQGYERFAGTLYVSSFFSLNPSRFTKKAFHWNCLNPFRHIPIPKFICTQHIFIQLYSRHGMSPKPPRKLYSICLLTLFSIANGSCSHSAHCKCTRCSKASKTSPRRQFALSATVQAPGTSPSCSRAALMASLSRAGDLLFLVSQLFSTMQRKQ